MKCLNKIKTLLLMSGLLISSVIFSADPIISKTDTLVQYEQQLRALEDRDRPIKMEDVPAFMEAIRLPSGILELFKDIEIDIPTFSKGPEGFEDSLEISGKARFKGKEMLAKFIVVVENGIKQFSLSFALPEGMKLSDVFSQLRSLDKLELPYGYFILSSFAYKDKEFDLDIEKDSLTFVADINLSGPLEPVNNFINNLKDMAGKVGKAFILEVEKFRFTGVLRQKIEESSFSAFLPLHIGIDFVKLGKGHRILSYIKTRGWEINFKPIPDLSFTINSGILIGLPTQQEPIVLIAEAEVSATMAALKGYMDGMWDPAFGQKWLALGEFGVEMNWDYAYIAELALVGIPFSGLGMRGKLNLGEPGEKRAEIALSAAVSLETEGLGDYVFEGKAENLRLSDFILFLVRLAKKDAKFDLPTINLSKLGIYISPTKADIAGREYESGITVDAEMELGKLVGGIGFRVNPDDLTIAGSGRLNNVEKKFFKLTGVGPDGKLGTEDDGPSLSFLISGERPEESNMKIDGQIEIPSLAFKEKIKLDVSKSGVVGDFEIKIADLFEASMELNFQFDKPSEFLAKFDLRQSFIDIMREKIKNGLEKKFEDIKKKMDTEFDNLVAKVEEAKTEFDRLKNEEIDRVIGQIDRLDGEIDELNETCLAPLGEPGAVARTAACAEVTKKTAEKIALIIYKELLLEPGAELTGELFEVSKKLADLEIVKKIKNKILEKSKSVIDFIVKGLSSINIRSASGEVSGKDLKEGKLPKLKELDMDFSFDDTIFGKRVKLKKDIKLQNIQFDFKEVAKNVGKDISKYVKLVVKELAKKLILFLENKLDIDVQDEQ